METPEISHTTCTFEPHVYEPDGYSEGNLISVVCRNCWHGCMIDPNDYEIKDGKIVSKKSK